MFKLSISILDTKIKSKKVWRKYLLQFRFYEKKSEGYNHFHNVLRLFDVLINFPFTASETMRDYYL